MDGRSATEQAGQEGEQLLRVLLKRRELVECLRETSMDKPELVAACGVSRSTVDRGVADLESHGIIRPRIGRYELTLFGATVTGIFQAAHDRLATLAAVEDLLKTVPDNTGLEAAGLADATVHRESGTGVMTMLEAFDGADRLRIVDPPLPLPFVGLIQGGGRLLDSETMMLVRSEVFEELQSLFSDTLDRFEGEGGGLGVLDRSVPFPFALIERGATRELCLLLGSSETGFATLTTEDEGALAWAEELYASLAQSVDPVTGVIKPDIQV